MKAATQRHTEFIIPLRISIHAAREGGDSMSFIGINIAFISIHAAREGGDQHILPFHNPFRISIHAAREGGDRFNIFAFSLFSDFNPRRP